jgi:hypothetical protein
MAVRDWDPTPYPDARDRKVAPGGAPTATVTAPVARIYTASFFPSAGANQVQWVVSPKFRGFGLIRSLSINYQSGDTAGQVTSVMVRVSEDGSGHGTYTSTAAGAPGYDIIDATAVAGIGDMGSLHPRGISLHTNVGLQTGMTIPINYPVTLAAWFLKLGFWSPGGAATQGKALAVVYEGIDADTLIDLMAGL